MELSLAKFRPLNNMVLLKKDPIYDADRYETKSGIIVMDSNKPKDRFALATIIKLGQRLKVGSGYKDLREIWSEGDRVFYYIPAQGTPLILDGEEYFLIRAEDIIQAKLEE